MLRTSQGRFAAQFIFQLILMAALSLIADQPRPGSKDINWDISLFLTPIGILKNSLAVDPVMRSFYSDLSKGQAFLETHQWVFIGFIFAAMLTNAFFMFRSLRGRDG